jgi:hypothetical protein
MKNFSLILSLFLVSTCFLGTGCSSPAVTKIAEKKAPDKYVLDLGYKNGGHVSVNLGFTKSLTDHEFKIKDITDGISGLLDNVDHIKLILNDENATPEETFNHTPLGQMTITSPISPATDVTFTGLQSGKSYYIAARAYSPEFTVSSTTVDINSNLSTNTVYASTPTDFDKLALNHGDLININGNYFTVDNIPAGPGITSFTVFPDLNITVNDGNYGINLQRNITSATGTTDGPGGGTQVSGESVKINDDGTLEIISDQTPGGSGANNLWDIVVQLQKLIGAQVTSGLTVTEGNDASGGPSVSMIP